MTRADTDRAAALAASKASQAQAKRLNALYDAAPDLLAAIDLRDYFAAKAMEVDYTLAKNFTEPDWRYGIALDAYKMADAMLKARETP